MKSIIKYIYIFFIGAGLLFFLVFVPYIAFIWNK